MSYQGGRPVDVNGVAVERRRAGRRDVKPELIPLLRNPVGNGILPDAAQTDITSPFGQDRLAPARGIVMSLLFSVPIWGLVGFAFAR
jgi:hypothetical protein